MCYAWLKTFEETTNNPPLPYYITILDDEKIIAASVCYFNKRNNNIRSIDNILLGRLNNSKWLKNISFLPAVNCGPKNGYGTHFLFSKELKQNEINKLQNQLIDIIENIAVKHKASIYFSNITNQEIFFMQTLTKRRYYKTKGLPLNYIDIKWSSFDKFKQHLRKKYPSMNKTIAREINKNRKSGIAIKELQNINNHQQRLFKLLEMNYEKYNSTALSLKPDYFFKIKKNFGNNSFIYAAIKEEKIIGVIVELRRNKEAVLTSVGIDHNISKNDFTYFNIAFYEPIRNAPECGIERIYGGNALYKTKARRGFSTADTYIFYKPNYGLLNYFVKIWFSIHYLWMTRKLSYIKQL